MRKLLLCLLFLSILIFPSWVHADPSTYLNIPPTNAFDKAHSQNGTINAVNYSMPINFIGRNGVNVTSNNSTHTIIIIGNGTGPRGATGATGNFTCNTANNCVNLNDTQTITGLKYFFEHAIINGTLIGWNSLSAPDFTLQPLDSNNMGATSGIDILPKNGTNNSQLQLFADTTQINILKLQSQLPNANIEHDSNSTNSFLNLIDQNPSNTVTVTLDSTNNNVFLINQTGQPVFLSNIENPVLNQDAVTKYWHDHYLGQIGNLTQNKCSNLEFLAYQQSNQTWICSTATKGTYNETLANDSIINSGGNKINFINGTGNPVKVINSNSGQQVNVTISSNTATFSQSLIDLTSSSYQTNIENDTADTLIPDTTKPTNPQITKTILSADIPNGQYASNYCAYFSVGGKNTDVSTRSINWHFTLNGADIAGSDGTLSITTANPFYKLLGSYCGSGINANDVLGVKLWGSVTNVIDYRYYTIWIVPRVSATIGNQIWELTKTNQESGSISGVTYTSGGLSFIGYTALEPTSSTSVSLSGGGLTPTMLKGMNFQLTTLTSVNTFGSATTSSASLYGPNQYKYIDIVGLS